jgi:AcrR family transcriptional regulator
VTVAAAENADLALDPRGEATRTRILDSAEYLFSEHGINGASLRAIVAHAGVNTAAVHYHFGSKKGLLEAVFARRIIPIAEERLKLLAECRDGDARPPLLEQIIAAFLEPGMRGSHGGATFARLRARMAADASDETRALMARYFDQSSAQFLAALADALPHLPPRDLHWRFHFMHGRRTGLPGAVSGAGLQGRSDSGRTDKHTTGRQDRNFQTKRKGLGNGQSK